MKAGLPTNETLRLKALHDLAILDSPREQSFDDIALVTIAITRNNEWVRISVRDCGPGIADEFKARIFQKFSQADSSDSRLKGGTGLGLAISKELVERMGGQIGFETKLGHGSCFFAEFTSVKSMS